MPNNISRHELQKIIDNNDDLSRFITEKKLDIPLAPSSILHKPHIGLISRNYVIIRNQDLSDLEIGNLQDVIFEDCNFISSKFTGNLDKVIFNRSKISNADFTNIPSLDPSQIYRCNDCLEAHYHNHDDFQKNLMSNFFTDENINKNPAILPNITGDKSRVVDEYINVIEKNNRQINNIIEISAPTNSNNLGFKFNTQKTER